MIVSVAADAVGVTLNLQLQPGMSFHDAGKLRQRLARGGLQIIFCGVKQHIGHVHFQSARRIRGWQDAAKLLKKSRTKVLFLLLGTRRGCLSLRCSLLSLGGGLLFLLGLRVGEGASLRFLLSL